MQFVVRSVSEPEEITAIDMQRLRDLEWDDSDVLDATFLGAFMLTSGVLFNTFKMMIEQGQQTRTVMWLVKDLGRMAHHQ